MKDSGNTLLKLLLIAGAGLAIYWWLQQSGYWTLWFGGAAPAAGATATGTTTPIVTTTTTTAVPAVSVPSSYLQAAAAMTSAAGQNMQNFDQWSYWWQNDTPYSGAPTGYGVSGSISPNMEDAMIAAGGGNRAALITATQWVTILYSQQQAGLSGFGALPQIAPMWPREWVM